MNFLFVYGSLKRGFANEHVNTGLRVQGQYRTRNCYRLYLLGLGEVPCVVVPPGFGCQVIGELYRVTADDLQRMDLLERVGEAEGYERVTLDLERFDRDPLATLSAFAYVRHESTIAATAPRIGPLDEYRREHAARFHWKGAV